jgi:WD40 repeat protein
MTWAFPARTTLVASLAVLSLGAAGAPAQDRPAVVLRLPRDAAALAVAHDGKRPVTSDSKKLRLWDVGSGKPLRALDVRADFGPVWGASFSRDGTRVLVAFGSGPGRPGDRDCCARVFDAATGRRLREFRHTYPVFAAAISPDGSRVLTGTGGLKDYRPDDVVMRLWSARTGKEVRVFPHPTSETRSVEAVAFSADGTVAYSRGNHLLFRWDVKTGKELGRTRFGEPQLPNRVLFTANGRALAFGGGSVRLWDLKRRAAVRELRADVLGDPRQQFRGDVFSQIDRYEISADGKTALVALATMRRTVEVPKQSGPGRAGAPLATVTPLASYVVLWDVEGDKVARTFSRAAGDSAYPVLLSGDGRTALLGTARGFQVWKLSRGGGR